MKPEVGEYFYMPFGQAFRIYRYDFVGKTTSSAEPVSDEPYYRNSEDARKRVYELNGWRYKPCKKN